MRDYLLGLFSHFELHVSSGWVNPLLLALVLLLGITAGIAVRLLLNSGWWLVKRYKRQLFADDRLMRRLIRRSAALTLPLVLHASAPLLFDEYPRLHRGIGVAAGLYLLWTITQLLTALLALSEQLIAQQRNASRLPLRSVFQMAKLFLIMVALLIGISIIFGKTPLYILSGFGALTAVVLLVFKDALLGFVGGLQLSANDMVRLGDWIEMPKYGADGDVIEVGLTTVKVRNWDKTITTVPTYALVTDAFKNWRGMTEAGGRRIKRAIHIDIQSVHFARDEELQQWLKLSLLRPYLQQKQAELDEEARQHADEDPLNRRHLTNIGTFRAYLERYLRQLALTNLEHTLLVRQLPPEANGLPIEIYLFCRDTRWAYYEAFQADIFDHIFAMLPTFGLRAYQAPAGHDLRYLAATAAVTTDSSRR